MSPQIESQEPEVLPSRVEAASEKSVTANLGLGPRTLAGKNRSKHNSHKHQIFSRHMFLDPKTRNWYEVVRRELLNHFQPLGPVESVLVYELADTLLRQRLRGMAENAKIQLALKSLDSQSMTETQREAEAIEEEWATLTDSSLNDWPGLVKKRNRLIIAKCIEMLTTLRNATETEGPEEARDMAILDQIYGFRHFQLFPTLRDFYCEELYPFDISGEEENRKPDLSPELKRTLFKKIDEELTRLKALLDSLESEYTSRINLERLCLSILPPTTLELTNRYETHLDRRFGKKLSQLQDLQRARRGESVPPTLKVQID